MQFWSLYFVTFTILTLPYYACDLVSLFLKQFLTLSHNESSSLIISHWLRNVYKLKMGNDIFTKVFLLSIGKYIITINTN